MALTLCVLPQSLAVCRLEPGAKIPAWVWRQPFFCAARTDDETSLLLDENLLKKKAALTTDWAVEGNWRAFKVLGPLDFSLTGILSAIAAPLAAAGISIFALSTYDTDYVLVRAHALDAACTVLSTAGYLIKR
ncbi:MAG: ACT domain-containing protein [Anaerolineae bacterium]|nr:ACT domain-containing protein [Anaerolineae bacterium]